MFNYVTQNEVPGRNSAATSFFQFTWDGTRSHDNGGGNGDHRKAVPNGRYLLKLSVLKALGNATSAADWETYTTPPITLAGPSPELRPKKRAPLARGPFCCSRLRVTWSCGESCAFARSCGRPCGRLHARSCAYAMLCSSCACLSCACV